jgi:hypothetical protein
VIVVGISLIAPSYVWVQWTIDHPILKPLWSDKEGKFSRWRAMLWFSLPLIIFLGGTFSVYLIEKQWHTSFGAVLSLATLSHLSLRPCFSGNHGRNGGR